MPLRNLRVEEVAVGPGEQQVSIRGGALADKLADDEADLLGPDPEEEDLPGKVREIVSVQRYHREIRACGADRNPLGGSAEFAAAASG